MRVRVEGSGARPRRLALHLGRAIALSVSLLFGLAGFAGGVMAGDGDFIAEIPDLPLMPGLDELSDAGVVFDKPSGRIVEAYAQGAVSREAVFSFYGQSLPQLGWSRAGDDRFVRDGEALTIEVVEDSRPLTLRFVLRPL